MRRGASRGIRFRGTAKSSIAILRNGRRMLVLADIHRHMTDDSSHEWERASRIVETHGGQRISTDAQAVTGERVADGHGDRNVSGADHLVVDEQLDGSRCALAELE